MVVGGWGLVDVDTRPPRKGGSGLPNNVSEANVSDALALLRLSVTRPRSRRRFQSHVELSHRAYRVDWIHKLITLTTAMKFTTARTRKRPKTIPCRNVGDGKSPAGEKSLGSLLGCLKYSSM
jgi:hypothetical protein